jgi:hypothetical protein
MSEVPALWEAEAGGSPDPRSSRIAWKAMRHCLKKKIGEIEIK